MTDTCSIPSKYDHSSQEADFDPGPGKHVLFFGDPMCSWCWGFAPELDKLAKRAQGHAQFHIVMGGLRPGTREAWDPAMRSYIRHHWEDVAAKTGQPFDFARFDDEDFIYDTEPGCRALICVRELEPPKTLDMYESLQRAFYADNLDITTTEVLANLAVNQGVDRSDFLELFNEPATRSMVAFDFQRTQAFGVQGFPSVLCAEDGQYAFLALGYRRYAEMKSDLEAWLKA